MPEGHGPGSGAVLAAVEMAGGTKAETFGKPSLGLFATALDRLGPGRALVVGDQLDICALSSCAAIRNVSCALCSTATQPAWTSSMTARGSSGGAAEARPAPASAQELVASMHAMLPRVGIATLAELTGPDVRPAIRCGSSRTEPVWKCSSSRSAPCCAQPRDGSQGRRRRRRATALRRARRGFVQQSRRPVPSQQLTSPLRRTMTATFAYEAANQAARMTMVQRPIETTIVMTFACKASQGRRRSVPRFAGWVCLVCRGSCGCGGR
jgi:hypothetical protein